MPDMQSAVLERLDKLPADLQGHVRRVRDIAGDLAARHGVDAAAVDLAAAGHDLARAMKGNELLREAERYGLEVHPIERRVPVLLHGGVAAAWLERTAGLSDRRVLEAVQLHTNGGAEMGEVARLVFVADKLDPDKADRYPFLNEIERMAQDDIDLALLEFLSREMARRLERGDLVHPASLELRNELLMAAGGVRATEQYMGVPGDGRQPRSGARMGGAN